MNFKATLLRAKRGFREDARLYLVAISSLTVAFLCLSVALLGVVNLDRLAQRWGSSARMTVYLRDGVSSNDIEELRVLLSTLPDIEQAEYVSAANARESFLKDTSVARDLDSLPADVFPASLELKLHGSVQGARLTEIADRIARFSIVDDVETYRGFFERMDALLWAARSIALALALLVGVCVIAVVGNTIRLAVAGRRSEIEVMKLCGATNSFVSGPFITEGVLQGTVAASLSILIVFLVHMGLQSVTGDSFASMVGVQFSFLGPVMVLGVVAGGAITGALGSTLSLRRYLAV